MQLKQKTAWPIRLRSLIKPDLYPRLLVIILGTQYLGLTKSRFNFPIDGFYGYSQAKYLRHKKARCNATGLEFLNRASLLRACACACALFQLVRTKLL